MIDLSAMNAVDVDPAARTVRVQGGATWGAVDAATHEHGLATAVRDLLHHRGRRAHAGRRARLPVAQVRADHRQPARGRGRAGRRAGRDRVGDRASRPVLGAARWRRQLRRRDVVRVPAAPGHERDRRPDPVAGGGHRRRAELVPGLPAGPERGPLRLLRHDDRPARRPLPGRAAPAEGVRGGVVLHGRPGRRRRRVRAGPRAWRRSGRASARCRTPACSRPSTRSTRRACSGTGAATSSATVPDEAVAVHARFAEQLPSLHSTMHLYPIDGAVQRVGAADTAWSYRDVTWSAGDRRDRPGPGATPRRSPAGPSTTGRRTHPYSAGGAYVNFMMDEGQDRVRATYQGNYDRLCAVKGDLRPGERAADQPEHPAAPLAARHTTRPRRSVRSAGPLVALRLRE